MRRRSVAGDLHEVLLGLIADGLERWANLAVPGSGANQRGDSETAQIADGMAQLPPWNALDCAAVYPGS